MKKKSYSTSDGYQARDLVHYGVDHIKAAKVLFEKEASLFDSGGYLAHLGLELLLKAWLLEVSSEFPKTHSLVALVNKLNERQKQIELSEEDKTLLRLIDEYGELRYPTPTNPIGVGDDDWPKIEDFFYTVLNQAPNTIQLYAYTIDPTKKGGRELRKKPK